MTGNTYAQLPDMIQLAKTDYLLKYYVDPDKVVSGWIQNENARIVSFEN